MPSKRGSPSFRKRPMHDPAAEPAESPSQAYGILIVDDEEAILESLELTLGAEYRVFTASNGRDGLAIFDAEDIALVVVDQNMPGMTGVEFLEKVIERDVRAIRMMLTGYTDISSLARAINSGRIYRYITKPWEPDELRLNIKRALESYALSSENSALTGALAEANARLRDENRYLRNEVERRYSFEGLIGDSPAMQRVFDVTEKVAETDATVLITGETGTGKDLIARAIHYAGPRKDKRFVAQNCAALPDTLLESELFGHERGAFTGAVASRVGRFQEASGGTLFLDEIGDMSPDLQAKLLRVLQNREVTPVGSTKSQPVDIRILAATHRDLDRAIEQGTFREDLLYRLRVMPLHIPPLREHPEDIAVLAEYFLSRYCDELAGGTRFLSESANTLLTGHDWPGNVRELENAIKRALVLSTTELLVAEDFVFLEPRENTEPLDDLPRLVERDVRAALAANETGEIYRTMLERVERPLLEAVLEHTDGNQIRAAAMLGINRNTLRKKISELGISVPGRD